MKKTLTVFLMTALVLSCVNNTSSESPVFKKGNLMTDVSVDPFGTPLVYPEGEPSVTTITNVWEPGFESPWHYHPYTGIAYVVQGELTVNYDSETSLDDIGAEKTIITSQTYKAGDKAFLGVANMWHISENKGSEDLIFIVSWLGEKDKPLAVLEEK